MTRLRLSKADWFALIHPTMCGFVRVKTQAFEIPQSSIKWESKIYFSGGSWTLYCDLRDTGPRITPFSTIRGTIGSFFSLLFICSFPWFFGVPCFLPFVRAQGLSMNLLRKAKSLPSWSHLPLPLSFLVKSQAFANTLKEELLFVALGFSLRGKRSGVISFVIFFHCCTGIWLTGLDISALISKGLFPFSSCEAWDLKFYL